MPEECLPALFVVPGGEPMPARRLVIDGREQIDPRHTRAWRTLRDQVVAEEPLCWLQLPGVCTQVSTTADHVIPVTERPDLALDRANVHGSCRPCNDRRGSLPVEALNRGGPAGPVKPAALSVFGRR